MTFTSQLWRRGFRAQSPATDIIENGTFANNADFAPTIGMDRNSLLQDRAKRRHQELPGRASAGQARGYEARPRATILHADWVMSDITLSTDAGQISDRPRKRGLGHH